MHQPRKLHGFSLIEIIIAIAIIALFITLPVLAYSNYAKNARNEKRKSDVLKVSQALEQYKAQKGVYPIDLQDLVSQGYLPELPIDPKHGEDADGDEGTVEYGYSYDTDGISYTLSAALEGDTEGIGGSSGPGTFIVNPANPGGKSAPIIELTQKAIDEPSPTVPSATPYISPTSGVAISITGVPCNETIVCTGPCQPLAGRCAPASYASTQSGCSYTMRNGRSNCSQASATDQACNITAQSCSSPLVCVGTFCQSPTPTPTNTPTNTPTRTPTPTFTNTPTPTPVRFVRSYNGPGSQEATNGIKNASGGGFVFGMQSYGYGFVAAKVNSLGAVVWSRYTNFGSAQTNDAMETDDGGAVIVGNTTDSYWSPGRSIGTITRLTSAGGFAWANSFHWNAAGGDVYFSSVMRASNGDLIVAGGARGKGFIVRHTQAATYGGYYWQREHSGVTYFEQAAQTTSGNIVATGYSASGTIALINYQFSDGAPLWGRTIDGASYDASYGLAATSDGGVIVSSLTSSYVPGSYYNGMLTKLDSSGNHSWTRVIGTNAGDDNILDVIQTTDLGYAAVGTTGNKIMVVKTNGSGDISWVKSIGKATGSWTSYEIVQTTDGGYAIGGYGPGGGTLEPYIIKLDSTGACPGCADITDTTASFFSSPQTPAVAGFTPTAGFGVGSFTTNSGTVSNYTMTTTNICN